MTTYDPVCGEELEEATAAAEVDYKGNRYYFHSEHCKEQFERQPDQFLSSGQHPSPGA